MSETEEFLDAVDDHLPFVGPVRFEIIDELLDHIDASALELEAKGMAPYDAEREAIRRMGDPEQLATDLGKAREGRARLVPAAGYVAVGVVKTWLGGYGLGLLVLVAVSAVTLIILHQAGMAMPASADLFRALGVVGDVLMIPFVAYLIGRATPYRLALGAHRSLEWAKRVTMLVGAAVLLALALFTDRTAPDVWMVGGALAAPLLLVLGARASEDEPASLVRWRDLAGLAVATLVVVLAAAPLRPSWVVAVADTFGSQSTPGVGLILPGTDRDISIDDGPLLWVHLRLPVGHDALFEVIEDSPGRPELSDRRVEIWSASPDGMRPDPAAMAPLFSLPVPEHPAIDAGTLDTEVRLDTHLMREWPRTWRVLTATASDGTRVVVDYASNGADLAYQGTALDWLLGR